jgi:hypothetical protein
LLSRINVNALSRKERPDVQEEENQPPRLLEESRPGRWGSGSGERAGFMRTGSNAYTTAYRRTSNQSTTHGHCSSADTGPANGYPGGKGQDHLVD